MTARPTWQLVLEAAEKLSAEGDFKLEQLISEVRRLDSSRERPSIQPVVQGMTANAGSGPASPCGKPLWRVTHGWYQLLTAENGATPAAVGAAAVGGGGRFLGSSVGPVAGARRNRDVEVERRVAELVSGFGHYVEVYDLRVPFARKGQFEMHLATIGRRRRLGTVAKALADDLFLNDLYGTLQAWGIGRRASRLVPLAAFRERLRACEAQFRSLEQFRLSDPIAGSSHVTEEIRSLIGDIHVVDNRSLIVPGTKTLHHLLPDLVPPMDRAWTGAFFRWSAAAPQSGQSATFARTFQAMARVAREVSPEQYVGPGWRTCSAKIVDNALVGFCKERGIEPRGF